MNNELIRILTAKEYLETFLSKNLRIDRRDLNEKRQIDYQFGILDTFSTSASCLLGDSNKIIAVMKSHNKDISEITTENLMNLVVENLTDISITSKSKYSEPNLLHFMNKLIENNLELEIPCPLKFSLHITIINSNGNIYDCIANLISNLFSGKLTKENECGLNRYVKLKKKFVSNTFCVIGDKLLIDPSLEEVNYCSYYFSIVKFDNEEYIIHKIKGESINWAFIEEAFSLF